jgi:lipid A 3-O-deacylase
VALDFNARYHHISNAGTASPNMPLNGSKLLLGISHFW